MSAATWLPGHVLTVSGEGEGGTVLASNLAPEDGVTGPVTWRRWQL